MGRPVKDKFFGDPATRTEALYLIADIGAGIEQCFFVAQKGTRIYRVESVNSGVQAEVQLVNGPEEITHAGLGYLEASEGANSEVESAVLVSVGSGYDVSDTVTLSGGTASQQAILTVETVQPVDGQTQANYNNVGSNGTFAGGSSFDVADTITLSDGSVVTVNAVDGGNSVTQFAVDSSNSTGGLSSSTTLTQDSSSGDGTGFSLTLDVGNQAISSVSITNQGIYSILPSNPVSPGATSGSGTGATFNLGFGSLNDEYVRKLSNRNLITFEPDTSRVVWEPVEGQVDV